MLFYFETGELMSDNIRILAVAPYESMASLLQNTAASFPDVSMDILVGNLDQAVQAAEHNLHQDYDVLISRGGTATLLQSKVTLPVVEIPISLFDLLSSIRLVKETGSPFAIVGYPNIAKAARDLCTLLELTPEIYTTLRPEDNEQAMDDIRAKGLDYVICDVAASQLAWEKGLNAVLIISGIDSITEAVQDARRLCRQQQELRVENHFLRTLLRGQPGDTVVYARSDAVVLSTLSQQEHEAVSTALRELAPAVRDGSLSRCVKSIGGHLYRIRCEEFEEDAERYTAFYLRRSNSPRGNKHAAISYYTQKDAQDLFRSSYYNAARDIRDLAQLTRSLQEKHTPLMLHGAPGTGKRQVVAHVYTHSRLKADPLVVIDCSLMNEKALDYLINSHHSPLCCNDQTIYIASVDKLEESVARELVNALECMQTCRSNHMIFSCLTPGDSPQAHLFTYTFYCMSIYMPVLKSVPERIPSLATLYLAHLHAETGDDVVRLEPGALAQLQEFDWPGNYIQFERVLNQLAVSARSHVIQEKEARRLLAHERGIHHDTSGAARYPADLTLAEIERDIIQQVLSDCDGNQSAAARRLGIGRTTLWRLLKNS